eukprot:8722686-Pyramimonas_sp.AAC.2
MSLPVPLAAPAVNGPSSLGSSPFKLSCREPASPLVRASRYVLPSRGQEVRVVWIQSTVSKISNSSIMFISFSLPLR